MLSAPSSAEVEVGIIDYEESNERVSTTKNKWVNKVFRAKLGWTKEHRLWSAMLLRRYCFGSLVGKIFCPSEIIFSFNDHE